MFDDYELTDEEYNILLLETKEFYNKSIKKIKQAIKLLNDGLEVCPPFAPDASTALTHMYNAISVLDKSINNITFVPEGGDDE